MKLFPHTLVRVAGAPFGVLQQLHVEKSIGLIREITSCEQKRDAARDRVCHQLFGLIQACSNPALQKKLLNLKRDIYNNRPLSDHKVQVLREHLPNATALEELIENKSRLLSLDEQGASVFAGELRQVRANLKQACEMDALLKGLVLSSQTLLKAMSGYGRKGFERLKKKDLKTELSLIQYLSRICAKTSPFSTFTNLNMAPLHAGQAPLTVAKDGVPVAVGQIRLNNTLFAYLSAILRSHEKYKEVIPIRPNPTLTREADCFVFLINSQNIESFQRLPLDPVLDLFWSLAAASAEGLKLGELVAGAQESIDASAEDLRGYIDQLIEIGFLEHNPGISGIDIDWDLKLGEQLKVWGDGLPFAQELAKLLADLRSLAGRYAEVSAFERINLLNQAFTQFHELSSKLHASAGLPEEQRLLPEERQALLQRQEEEKGQEQEEEKEDVFKHIVRTTFNLKPEQMFYEDCALNLPLTSGCEALTPVIEALDGLQKQLAPFSPMHHDKDKMAHFFRENFKGSVPVLGFYETYFREYKKPEMARREKAKKAAREKGAEPVVAPALLPAIARRKNMQDEVAAAFKAEVAGTNPMEATPVTFSRLQIEAALAVVPQEEQQTALAQSCSAFLQFYTEGSRTRAVLNGVPIGYGKMFSRFLHLFEPSVTEAVRQENRTTHATARMVEDCDASIFNANLHPPLLPYEIWMPGSHNSLPADHQVPVTELVIRRNEADQLELRHAPSGDLVYVFDLGFQGSQGRSELFQLLQRFSPALMIPMGFLLNLINEPRKKTRNEVTVLPRILFDDCLVLQRQGWLFPRELLPVRAPQQSLWSYFREVWQWKAAHNLPDDVFISITDRNEWESLDEEQLKKVRGDDYKPQYISFANPILIRLFEKLVDRVPITLRVSEMLPTPTQLTDLNGEDYVTETIVQWKRA